MGFANFLYFPEQEIYVEREQRGEKSKQEGKETDGWFSALSLSSTDAPRLSSPGPEHERLREGERRQGRVPLK